MKDTKKTKQQLINDLMELRRHASQLEAGVAEQKRLSASLAEQERRLRRLNEDLTTENAEREKAEAALRESEQKYRLLVDNANELICVIQEGRFAFVNRRSVELSGYSEEELAARSFLEIVHPDDREIALQHYAETMGSQTATDPFVLKVINKWGNTRWGYVRGVRIDWDGGPAALVFGTEITDLKIAEEAFIKEKAFSEGIIDSLPGIFYLLDEQLGLVRWNKNFEKVSGLSGQKLSGMIGLDFFQGEDRQIIEEGVRDVLEEGEATRDANLAAKDGNRTSYLLTGRLITVNGKRYIVGMGIDMTARKQAEDALRESEEKYRLHFENASDVIYSYDRELRFLDISPSVERVLGYSPQELKGKQLSEIPHLLPPEYLEKAIQEAGHVLAGGRVESSVYHFIGKDGRTFIGEVSVAPLVKDGNIVGVVGVGRDITERTKAEDALRKSEERFRAIFEAATDCIFIKDRERRYTHVNPAMEKLFGLPSPELVGKMNEDLFGIEVAGEVAEADGKVLSGETVEQEIFRPVKGSLRVFHIVKVPIRDQSGSVTTICGIARDITHRKRAEELLVQAERLKAIGDLAGGVAHNFNNLLQVVMGGIDLALVDLEMGNLSEIKKTLEQLLEGAKFGAETVRRLQSFAQVRAEIADSEADVFDLSETARQAVEMTKTWWKTGPEKEGISLSLHLNLIDGCLVRGKQGELFEVLINLIKNAAEALPGGGDIRIRTTIQDDKVVLEVADTGMGIQEKNLKKVFQPFWSTKGVATGTGMGLAVTQGIVASHGGTISVMSKEGTGATFTIALPLAKQTMKEPAPSGDQIFLRKLNILVVDDMVPILMLLERIFTKHDQTVFAATSGEEALDIFKNNKIDLVICDLGMPGLNGWDVGKAIKRSCRDQGIPMPPFILLTGWGGQELDQEKISESGVDAIIAKPLDNKKLMEVVRKVVQESRRGPANI